MTESDKPQFDKLLSSFIEKANAFKKYECKDNFFLVAGYPHYENVVSNILAFFFQTDESHGMGDLWISSLAECYYEVSKKQITDMHVRSVSREVVCDEQKRIDLLLEMQESVIVIENKIWADPVNPWALYHKSVVEKYEEFLVERKPIEILLSVRKERNIINDKEGYEFYNITYDMLLDRIQARLGDYIQTANYKWFVFMNEFIINIRRMIMSVNPEIDSKWNKYIAKNNATIAKFWEQIESDRKEKRAWLDSLQRKIEEYLNEGHNGTCGRYNSGSYSSVYIDLPIKADDKDETLVLEPYMMNSFSGQEHEKSTVLYLPVWCRTDKKSFDYQKLLDKLESKYKKTQKNTSPSSGWGKWYIVKEYDLTQELKFDEVVKDIQDLINIIEEVYH